MEDDSPPTVSLWLLRHVNATAGARVRPCRSGPLVREPPQSTRTHFSAEKWNEVSFCRREKWPSLLVRLETWSTVPGACEFSKYWPRTMKNYGFGFFSCLPLEVCPRARAQSHRLARTAVLVPGPRLTGQYVHRSQVRRAPLACR